MSGVGSGTSGGQMYGVGSGSIARFGVGVRVGVQRGIGGII